MSIMGLAINHAQFSGNI